MVNAYVHPIQKTIAIIPVAIGMATKEEMIKVGYWWLSEYSDIAKAEAEANEVLSDLLEYKGDDFDIPEDEIQKQTDELIDYYKNEMY